MISWFEAAAITLVFTEGSLFKPLRERGPRLWRAFAGCPLCVGVWVGWGWAMLEMMPLPDVFAAGPLSGVLALSAARVLDALESVSAAADERRELAIAARKSKQMADALRAAQRRP